MHEAWVGSGWKPIDFSIKDNDNFNFTWVGGIELGLKGASGIQDRVYHINKGPETGSMLVYCRWESKDMGHGIGKVCGQQTFGRSCDGARNQRFWTLLMILPVARYLFICASVTVSISEAWPGWRRRPKFEGILQGPALSVQSCVGYMDRSPSRFYHPETQTSTGRLRNVGLLLAVSLSPWRAWRFIECWMSVSM